MKHPTIEVPNLGPMDHAWDVLGDWQVELETPHHSAPIVGRLRVHTWTEADLELEAWGAAAAGLPDRVTLERASRVRCTDAGGGALQWVFVAPDDGWTVQATLWPGSLHLFFQDLDEPDHQLFQGVASRDREYYRRKYPLVPR